MVRKYLIVLASAAVGAILGWAGYWTQQRTWILGTCTGTVGTAPGSVPSCVPSLNVQVPLDPAGAISWAVGGALLALALTGLAVWLAIEFRERRSAS